MSLPGASQPPAQVAFDREACLHLDQSLQREWLEVDGLGGYAANTLLMCPTRRYHGLLVSTPPGHARRHVFLSRFEESLHGEGKHFALSIARYPGVWAPDGHTRISGFELAPFPRFHYQIGRVSLTREIMMVRGAPIVLCRYLLSGLDIPLELQLRPLLAFREADALTHRNLALNPRVERLPSGSIRCRPYAELPALYLTVGSSGGAAAARFASDPIWYENLEYQQDLARGYDGHEDQFCPGILHVSVPADREIIVAASLDGPVADPRALWHEEQRRRSRSLTPAPDLGARLQSAADTYLYHSPEGRAGVLAGFPWFGEWGRDTFIALPGLTLARGQLAACGAVLEGALPFLRGGLLPNIFGATPETSAYNSADAALWFALAVLRFDRAGGDRALLQGQLRPALVSIAEQYLSGGAPGLSADDDGLLTVADDHGAATWMDAMVDGRPVTSRHGRPVEINALWYSLLRYLEETPESQDEDGDRSPWQARRRQVEEAFLAAFWLPDADYLADRSVAGHADRRIRPNMVIAAALELSPLTPAMRAGVLRTAEAELLTPRGLRTLAPDDPDYQGVYSGGPTERDRAYHQGTVWPWLLGFYVEATLRAFPGDAGRLERRRKLVEGFAPQLREAGLGQISEVFAGDPPHRPGGAFAQAWSVAELLRAARLLGMLPGLPGSSESPDPSAPPGLPADAASVVGGED